MPALEVQLDAPLPDAIAVGGGTALFVAGTCFAPGAAVEALDLVVDGVAQPVLAHSMPRLDTLRALDVQESYRSGFWGLARIAPRAGATAVTLGLRARLTGGATAEHDLARIPLATPPEPVTIAAPAPHAGPLVAVCMATYEPPEALVRAQLDSIRAQTHANWVCVISDDCSSPARFAALEALVAGDPRFVVSRSPQRLGFYRNFERALALAPREAEHIALADQDDIWYPDKLAALLAARRDATLVYSDARIVGPDGALVAGTYWGTRENEHDDLLSLLSANAVTGAASLFPRRLLDDVLPFPPGQFAHFHDHWIALVARSLGEIAYVDRPLYDYVQHGDATLGHETATRVVGLRERLAGWRRDPRERVRMWRMHYFVDAARLLQEAAILRARCGERMPGAQRRALDRLERADRSPLAVARLATRGLNDLRRDRPRTLGAEWMLAHAFGWRLLLDRVAGATPDAKLRLDAVPPPALDPRPGAVAPAEPGLRVLTEKIEPLRLAVRDDAPRRINLLIPTIDLAHFFGGYIGKANLALRLARHGARVRLVTVDPVGTLPSDWRAQLEAYAGLDGLFGAVEVAFGRESGGLEVSRDDAWIATTWWTAYVARAAAEALGHDRIAYLIQEYEPFTFPMGSFAALAAGSYDVPHRFALFSTELLRDYFRRHGIGVFRAGRAEGDAASAAFQNAITAIEPPSAAELAARTTRRLLFYARPEPHAARNMYEIGVLALSRAVARGGLAGVELAGIGTVRSRRRVPLGAGRSLELIPRSAQGAYADLLRGHDIGLALMYTPHPSLVPMEMASAGMLTVTNSFENKTPEALAGISANLIAAEPTIDAVADALIAAGEAAGDADRRARGSVVNWSRDWDVSFPPALLDALLAHLEG
jgi:glycosyltransferase involved in cell wall biosynthesis